MPRATLAMRTADGFVVLAYELAGATDEKAFQAAQGGLDNGVVAVKFLSENVPFVDPKAIFAAGHCSAGDAALLLAAHDKRVRGVLAYNASGEGCWHQSKMLLATKGMEDAAFADFCQKTRAASHFGHLKTPAFLFTSEEDQSSANVLAAAKALTKSNEHVTIFVNETGDHYVSMIQSGIPHGIEWMKEQLSEDKGDQ